MMKGYGGVVCDVGVCMYVCVCVYGGWGTYVVCVRGGIVSPTMCVCVCVCMYCIGQM